MEFPIYPSNKLTVIIRNDAPMVHCDDHPTYRSVSIELTPDQVKALALKWAWSSGENQYYEKISQCFIEPKG